MDAPKDAPRRVPKDPGGFSRVLNELIQDGEIPAQAHRVYGALDHFLHKDTGVCDPSTTALAQYLHLSSRWVKAMIALLEARGSIIVDRGSGRRNRYVVTLGPRGKYTLARRETGEVEFTGSKPHTGEPHFTGEVTSPVNPTSPVSDFTGEPHFTGLGIPPNRDLRIVEEGEEATPPPTNADAPKPEPHLFATQHRHWLRTGLDYLAGESGADEAVRSRPWLSAAVADFFVRKCWANNKPGTDQRWNEVHNAFVWVKDLAGIDATQPETAEAMKWVEDNPVEKRYNRDDLRFRVLGRIRDRRRLSALRAARPAADSPSAAAHRSAVDQAWAAASETEREVARAAVRRKLPGLSGGGLFQAECERELLRAREEVLTGEPS
jgi:DNA-binding MarR family transcriptional regulator